MRRFLMSVVALAAVLLVVVPAAGAPKDNRPHLIALEFYEDLEDGQRYNLVATVTGQAEIVEAKVGPRVSGARLSRNIGPEGRGESWFFRKRGFVRVVREDLYSDGYAKLKVGVVAGRHVVIKTCELILEPDPVYGDYASGDCRRVDRFELDDTRR